MTKTVLITGSSSGIGLATAKYFQARGWNVIATMRSLEKAEELRTKKNIELMALDVTDLTAVKRVIAQAISKYKKIDALINNAGYGLVGPFESADEEAIQQQFAVNVFGVMRMTKALLPHFRANRSGVIVNISSIGGKMTFPMYSLYHSTKWAIEGFSEALSMEVAKFGIRVKLIEPGVIKTDFYGRSLKDSYSDEYRDYEKQHRAVIGPVNKTSNNGANPGRVAKVIYKAAISNSNKLRYPAAGGAKPILFLRRVLPEWLFVKVIKTGIDLR